MNDSSFYVIIYFKVGVFEPFIHLKRRVSNEKVKLVIFDLDNTLFSFNKLWIKANKDTFETYTLFKDIDYSDFMKLFENMIYTLETT